MLTRYLLSEGIIVARGRDRVTRVIVPGSEVNEITEKNLDKQDCGPNKKCKPNIHGADRREELAIKGEEVISSL
jgi:hypothetical protein